MDPASFSFAVVGMFLTCCRGYHILSDAKTAPSDAKDAACRVRIEAATLAAWGEHFELRQDLPEGQKSEKLSIHLLGAHVRSGVFDVLHAISETFTDIKRLDKRYGIVFAYHTKGDRSPRIPRDVQDLLEGRDTARTPPSPKDSEKEAEKMKRELHHIKTRMTLLEKCRWSLRGKERIDSMIRKLRRHNDDLTRLCTWEALRQINRGVPTLAVSQGKNVMDLHVIANIAEEAAKDATSPMAEGNQQTAMMARFKARVLTPPKVSTKYQPSWPLLEAKDYSVLSSSNAYSLATSLRTKEPVFVEWRSFAGKDGRPDNRAEYQIHELGTFLTVPDRPQQFRALDFVGLFRDEAKTQYGVVFELPKHLRGLRPETRRIYNPSTLSDLMHNVGHVLDLGKRFELAKKLINSVIVLHTCGWLHKDICSDNIIFFCPPAARGEQLKNSSKDIGRPIIVGYGLSRPDDVAAETQALSRQPPHSQHNYSRAPDRISAAKAKQTQLEIYRHPDKVAHPDRRFRHAFDIYSLGLVLLEIGLWQSLQHFDSSLFQDPYGYRKFVLDKLVPDLSGQCGSIYGSVVRQCLTLDSSNAAMAEESQRKLAWSIAERLDKCVA